MASPRCFTVPTSTLYASTVVTDYFTNTFTGIATLADGSVTQVLSLDVDSEVQTQVIPTATLYSTQCAVTTPASLTTTRQATRTALTRMTLESSSTQAGGNVVIATIIRTVSSAEVVVETQTIAPEAVATQTALNAQTHRTDPGAIAGGIVGAVAALGLLATCLWFVRKRRRNANATRNLDDFFNNPAAATGSDSSGGGATGGGVRTRRSDTLRSFRRSSTNNIVDLEKEQPTSGEDDGNHWAALAPQLDDILDEDNEGGMLQRHDSLPPTYGRAQSRKSLHTISRPMSFHSMANGFDEAEAEAAAGGLTPEGPIGSDIMYNNPVSTDQKQLLRNDSDRSSMSAVSPNDVVKPMVARSFDMLPPAMFNSNSPPPRSPTSPYGSPPPLRDLTLQEGVAYDAAQPSSPTSLTGKPSMTDDGRPRVSRGAILAMNGGGVLQHVGVAANTTPHPAAKPRSWSSSAFTVPDRPKSALGLSDGPQQQPRMSPFLSGNGMGMTPYESSSALQQSPPQSPPLGPSAPPSLRGRASLNGGQPQYMSPAYQKHLRQQQRSPPPMSSAQQQKAHLPSKSSPPNGRASSPTEYPPSQYAHLDVCKTNEERAEDRRLALAAAANGNGSLSRMISQHRPQRRHRSLSGDLLLRIANADSPPLTPAATDDDAIQRRMLSVRNNGHDSDGDAITSTT